MDKSLILGIVDATAVTALLLVGRFLAPADVELFKALVVAWQPITGALLLFWAYEKKLIVEVKKAESEERVAALYRQAETK